MGTKFDTPAVSMNAQNFSFPQGWLVKVRLALFSLTRTHRVLIAPFNIFQPMSNEFLSLPVLSPLPYYNSVLKHLQKAFTVSAAYSI
jgi:hypothetical protein